MPVEIGRTLRTSALRVYPIAGFSPRVLRFGIRVSRAFRRLVVDLA